jgi:hypothetical protein
MDTLPRDPASFTDHLAARFGHRLHRAEVQVAGPLNLLVDGEPVSLTNLYRAVAHASAVGQANGPELVEQFIQSYAGMRQLRQTPLPFDVVKGKILPRLSPLEAIAGSTSNNPLACLPYVNDTVILYAVDIGGASVTLTLEQLIRWGIDVEEIDKLSRENLASHEPKLELRTFQQDDAHAAIFNTGDGYDASRLLLQELHPQLAPDLGRSFYVAIPSRDVFIAFPPEPGDWVSRLRERVAVDYLKLPYPITADLFLVTLDGVAGSKDAA